jgi:hypothetical protein
VQDRGSRFAHIGLVMTMLAKVKIPFVMRTMSIHQQEELSVTERNTCSCSHPTWKSTSCVVMAKMLQTTLWVPMPLLPWLQHKKSIPIRLMGCVYTHRKRHAIEGCTSPSYIQSVVEKIGEYKLKVRKISRIISQTPTPRLKHYKI